MWTAVPSASRPKCSCVVFIEDPPCSVAFVPGATGSLLQAAATKASTRTARTVILLIFASGKYGKHHIYRNSPAISTAPAEKEFLGHDPFSREKGHVPNSCHPLPPRISPCPLRGQPERLTPASSYGI